MGEGIVLEFLNRNLGCIPGRFHETARFGEKELSSAQKERYKSMNKNIG
jgi:hypothetical protein